MSLWIKFVLSVMVLFLAGCSAVSGPELSPEMVDTMNAYADQQVSYSTAAEIARQCAIEPTALYWNEETKLWSVTCQLDDSPTIYGVVLIDDASYQVVHTEHINATSQTALEDIIAPIGWVRK
jgi:hypothetical protein